MAEEGKAIKKDKWWQFMLYGVVALGFSAYLYWDLTKFDEEGGTRRMSWFVLIPYQLLGKWGAVGVFVALAGFMFYCGIEEMRKSRQNPPPNA